MKTEFYRRLRSFGSDKRSLNQCTGRVTVILFPVLIALTILPSMAKEPLAERIRKNWAAMELSGWEDISISIWKDIVWLEGTVPVLAGRAAAVEIAKGTSGCRAVIDELQIVDTGAVSKGDLLSVIADRLNSIPLFASDELFVEVMDDSAIVRGTLPSHGKLMILKWELESISGLSGLDMQIRVSPNWERPDSEVEQELNQILLSDPLLAPAEKYSRVVYSNSVAYIHGKTVDAAHLLMSLNHARVAGVKIIDAGNLEPSEDASQNWERSRAIFPGDLDIETAVRDVLLYGAGRVQDLEVVSQDGTVELRGRVNSPREFDRIGTLVEGVVGVDLVVNQIVTVGFSRLFPKI